MVYALGLWGVGIVHGAGDPGVSTPTASVLEQWVQTRQWISKVRAEWQAEKEMLQQTRAMLEAELRALETAMSQVSTQSAVTAHERARVQEQLEQWDRALSVVKERLPAWESHLRKLGPAFPEPLRRTVQPLLDRLEGGPDGARSAWSRLQTVVTLLNEVEKFHSTVTLHPELRPGPEGKPLRVTVLYLGLAQAWYVDETGRVAGRGVPTLAGWNWTEEPGLAEAVRSAVQVQEGKQPAHFVSLRVEIP